MDDLIPIDTALDLILLGDSRTCDELRASAAGLLKNNGTSGNLRTIQQELKGHSTRSKKLRLRGIALLKKSSKTTPVTQEEFSALEKNLAEHNRG
jgi:hypothetical protein